MNSHDLSILVPWIIAHGYLIFLIVASIEGPLTTIAGGVAVSLGYFNIYIILILAIIADIGADIIYYYLGYGGHFFSKLPVFKHFGFGIKRGDKIKKLLHTHTNKALLLIKLSPVIGPIGIITIGTTRLKFKKFFLAALTIGLPKTIFFVFLGYYSGESYLGLNKIIAHGQYIALGIFLFLVLIYFVYYKIVRKITKGIQ